MHKTETYLPQDLIEIDDDTPKGHKEGSHKRHTADPGRDTGFDTDVDESNSNRHHAAKSLR